MPVIEQPPSEMVKRDTYRAGCHNKTRERPKLLVQDGYKISKVDGNDLLMVPVFRYIPDVMSKNCRQLGTLPECVGCDAEKDHEYIKDQRALIKKEKAK